MNHIIGYAVLATAAFFGLPTLAAGLFVLIRIPSFLAFCLVWLGIAYLWQLVLNDPIPIALLVAAFLWAGWSAKDNRLSEGGFHLAGAEMWAILVAGSLVVIVSGNIQWY